MITPSLSKLSRLPKWLLGLPFLLGAPAAWALEMADLTPPAGDSTIAIFNYVFGDVGGLFGTGRTTVFGDVMSVFNAGIMVVGGILLGYIILSGILKTAHEGEVLGKSWSSAWIPFRAALSMGMIIPGSGGYCLVQVFIMWIAMAGVGFADKVWQTAAAHITYGQSENSFSSDAGDIFDGLVGAGVCSTALNKIQTGNLVLIPPVRKQDASGTSYDFGPCGKIEIPKLETDNVQLNQLYGRKIQFIDGTIAAAASQYAQAFLADAVDMQALSKSYNTAKYSYIKASADYAKVVWDNIAKNDKGAFGAAKEEGWIFAGSFYLGLARNYSSIEHQSNSQVKVTLPNYKGLEAFTAAELQWQMDAFNSFRGLVAKDQVAIAKVEKAAGVTVRANTVANFKEQLMDSTSDSNVVVADMAKPLGDTIKGVLAPDNNNLSTKLGSWAVGNGIEDPIVSLAIKGDVLTTATIGITTAVVATYAGLRGIDASAAGSKAAQAPFGFTFSPTGAALGVLEYVGPFMKLITIAIVTMTLGLSTYLPLLPTLIWNMAVFGYLVLVVEAMIAAPLWAVMHAAPDGHEWSGKGAAGYMIVMNLFIRPTLYILGFLSALLLIKVFITFIDIALGYAVRDLDTITFQGIFAVITLLFVYIFASMQAVHRALQIITEVPTGIMKWIGGGHDPLGDNPASEGKSFMKDVMSKGEGGAKAALAVKTSKDPDETSGKDRKATSERMNEDIIPKNKGESNE